MSPRAIHEFQIVEENLRCAMRFFGEATGIGEVRSLEHTIAMYSGLDYGVFNMGLLDGSTGNVSRLDEAIQDASLYFKDRTHRWSFWLCEDLLDTPTRRRARMVFHEFGLRPISHPPGMYASALASPVRKLPHIECRPVRDAAMRRAFAEITSVCFEIPREVANAVYTPAGAWNGAYQGFVGFLDGRPIAISAVVSAAGALGLYSVGTLPSYRNRGYGEALMRATVSATQNGSPLVLQSTDAGHALYRRMGFRDVAKFSVYLTR